MGSRWMFALALALDLSSSVDAIFRHGMMKKAEQARVHIRPDGSLQAQEEDFDEEGVSEAAYIDEATAPTLRQLYTPTAAMEAKLQGLVPKCGGLLSVSTVADDKGDAHAFLTVAHLQKPGATKEAKKIMVVANEHAREVIAGETMLHFITAVCSHVSAPSLLHQGSSEHETVGTKSSVADAITAIGHGVTLVIVPVVNKDGRDQVIVHGRTCLRKTWLERASSDESDDGTDINRNGDVDWSYGEEMVERETHHGAAPFSTWEARVMRKIASQERPVAFLDIHSGANSLMFPFGYRMQVSPDGADHERAVALIKKTICPECASGANSVVIGYTNPGEIIDHMYVQQGIKYSMCWEIFEGEQQEPPTGVPTGTCAAIFNPLTPGLLAATKEKWATALSAFARYVDTTVHAQERTSSLAKKLVSVSKSD